MKAKVLFLVLLAVGFSSCSVQSQTTVYAKNSDISDNLDLRAVASIFGESTNLQDFERRLNDPKYQISNLDLNGDDQVDYLRVIESVEARTHVVIIQAVLDRDVYQDIATIDVERDNYNQVNVQVVGNSYLYGANYIYEPVYSVAPVIYTSFWITNYRPYISTWNWGYYPSYYYAWRPYPIYRYRNNINVCINVNNHYNYVNTRRSYRAPALYESRRTYGYEKMRPNNSFAQRHSNVNNRYELDQRRVASRETSRNSNAYNTNRSNTDRVSGNNNRNTSRDNSQNRTISDRSYNSNPVSPRDNQNRVSTPSRVENTQRTPEQRRDYSENNNSRGNSENRMNTNRTAATPRAEAPGNLDNNMNNSRGNSENRMNTNRTVATPRAEAPRNSDNNMNNSRGNSENRMSTNRTASSPRAEAPRNYSENRASTARPQAPQSAQRAESPRVSQESRGGQSQRENNSGGSRNGGRRI